MAATPWQTIGPFFHLPFGQSEDLPAAGDAVVIEGSVRDGDGQPVDAMLEVWHPDAGFRRTSTGEGGGFRLVSAKPGPVNVSVFAAGLLRGLATRIYFADESDANEADPVLASIEDPGARASLIAEDRDGIYRFDVKLQGPDETQFFEL